MAEANARGVVAYVPFTTFLSAISALEQRLPHAFDTSVWPKYSSAIQNQLLGTFRFLGLIDNSSKPTGSLKSLVQDKVNRRPILRNILESSYKRIVAMDLTKVSPKQFDKAMREYGMTGETNKKVVSFFLQAAKYAELPMSPLLGRKIRAVGSVRRKLIDVSPNGTQSVTARPLTSDPASLRTSKTIRLRNGGSLTLHVEGNFLEMGTDDRQFIFSLIDKLQEYERQNEITSK